MRSFRIPVVMFLVTLLLFSGCASASDVMSIDIGPKEWTWNPGELAVLEGTVVCDGNLVEDPLTLFLSIECTPDVSDAGNIVFAVVNDQKLSRMKQKSQYVIQKNEQSVLRFTGNWIIPDNVFLTGARVTLTISDQNGKVLKEAYFEEKYETEESYSNGIRFPELGKVIIFTLTVAAFIWLIAVVRITIHKRRGE